MTNDSYIAEHWNNQFEPNDSREESIMECQTCDGLGVYSDCCGAEIKNHTCSDCKEICEDFICPDCSGTGISDY